MPKRIKIGTRGSPLALAQAGEVKARLLTAHPEMSDDKIELIAIKTSGDSIQDRVLIEEGGKGLFTKEIEEQLLAGNIDFAVHSTKDMPAALPDGLILSTFLEREDPRDAFISKVAKTISELPEGAVVGTSSLRRQAQALALRPDLKVIPLRGNVETRLAKLARGDITATFLAIAGLNRLGLSDVITSAMDLQDFLPSPGQGAICLETRVGDSLTENLLAPLNHEATALAVSVERAVSKALGASCRMPLGAYARVEDGKLKARAALYKPNGSQVWFEQGETDLSEAEALGQRLGENIKKNADPSLFSEFSV